MHKALIFTGSMVTAIFFGSLWGRGGGFACGLIGVVISLALVTGMDSVLPVRKALPRWILLVIGTAWAGSVLGRIIDWFGGGSSAATPAAICGAVVGAILCAGIPTSTD